MTEVLVILAVPLAASVVLAAWFPVADWLKARWVDRHSEVVRAASAEAFHQYEREPDSRGSIRGRA